MGAHYRLNDPSVSSNRMGPGHVALGGKIVEGCHNDL